MQMLPSFTSRTVVVSSGPSAATAGGIRTTPAVPPNERVARNRRRVCIIGIGSLPPPGRSHLQLAFELVEKAPIRAVGNDLLRTRFDETHFAHAQCVEPDRVLRVVFAPFIVRDLV